MSIAKIDIMRMREREKERNKQCVRVFIIKAKNIYNKLYEYVHPTAIAN